MLQRWEAQCSRRAWRKQRQCPKYIHQKPLLLEKEEDSCLSSLAHLFLSCARVRALENALKNVLSSKETSSERFHRVEDWRQLCPSEGEVYLESWQSGGEDTSKHAVSSRWI